LICFLAGFSLALFPSNNLAPKNGKVGRVKRAKFLPMVAEGLACLWQYPAGEVWLVPRKQLRQPRQILDRMLVARQFPND